MAAINGTYTGGYSLAQSGPANSIFGGASRSAVFDGTSAYVDIPEGPFNITDAVTTVAWVDLLAIPDFGGIIGHGDASWRMSVNGSGQPGASLTASTRRCDATSANKYFWQLAYDCLYLHGSSRHVTTASLYVDGWLWPTIAVSLTPAGDSLDVWIGGSPDYGTARLLPAKIAHAAIFNRALTAAQVQGLYTGVFVAGPENLSITHTGSNVVLNWQSGTLIAGTDSARPVDHQQRRRFAIHRSGDCR